MRDLCPSPLNAMTEENVSKDGVFWCFFEMGPSLFPNQKVHLNCIPNPQKGSLQLLLMQMFACFRLVLESSLLHFTLPKGLGGRQSENPTHTKTLGYLIPKL